jgi:hypothetical protein
MNVVSQWVGAIGILIEFVGFIILGYELLQTSRAALDEAKRLAAEKSLFETLAIDEGTISDPTSGSAKVQGGLLGYMVDSIPRREAEAGRSRRMIIGGIAISGLGVFFQIAGAFGQAWLSN